MVTFQVEVDPLSLRNSSWAGGWNVVRSLRSEVRGTLVDMGRCRKCPRISESRHKQYKGSRKAPLL